MKYLFTFLFMTASMIVSASTYPISPVPLRSLIEKSEFIVVGYVSDIKPIPKETDHIATIIIKEFVQGKIEEDTIYIRFSPGMICPAPDMYFKDTYVLSFLVRNKNIKPNQLNHYSSVALNYGAKTLSLEDIEIYKERIREFQHIKTIENKTERFTATVECLVKCADNPITRWEGIFELSPESDFMSYYSKQTDAIYGAAITDDQNHRLKAALLDEKKPNYVDFGLVDIVYKGNEKEIDQFLINKFKILHEDEYWYAPDYMTRLKHMSNSPKVDTLILEYDKIAFDSKKIGDKKKIIGEFLNLVGGN